MTKFEELISRKKQECGSKFRVSSLDKRFIRFYNSGERIKVTYKYGNETEIKTGTVGITTGSKPVFLLMLTSRSLGSSYFLDKSVKKIEVIR